MRTRDIEKKIEELGDELQRYREMLLDNQRKTLVQCTWNLWGKGCGRRMQIGKLTYIQTHCYVEPHGCTGGDYWLPSEGQFDCPHCGHRNRLYDRPDIMKLKHAFKSIVPSHERSGPQHVPRPPGD